MSYRQQLQGGREVPADPEGVSSGEDVVKAVAGLIALLGSFIVFGEVEGMDTMWLHFLVLVLGLVGLFSPPSGHSKLGKKKE